MSAKEYHKRVKFAKFTITKEVYLERCGFAVNDILVSSHRWHDTVNLLEGIIVLDGWFLQKTHTFLRIFDFVLQETTVLPSIRSKSGQFCDKTFLCLKLYLTYCFTVCTIFTNNQFPTKLSNFNNYFAHIPSLLCSKNK